jgi:hypothetical protein
MLSPGERYLVFPFGFVHGRDNGVFGLVCQAFGCFCISGAYGVKSFFVGSGLWRTFLGVFPGFLGAGRSYTLEAFLGE